MYQDADKCLDCPKGSYQSDYGQTACVQCPAGRSTLQEHAKNLTQCVGQSLSHCFMTIDFILSFLFSYVVLLLTTHKSTLCLIIMKTLVNP